MGTATRKSRGPAATVGVWKTNATGNKRDGKRYRELSDRGQKVHLYEDGTKVAVKAGHKAEAKRRVEAVRRKRG